MTLDRDVMHILGELDVKGTGDIEFDEFIYSMTRPQVHGDGPCVTGARLDQNRYFSHIFRI